MTKQIWLPESETHVIIEDGQIKIWDSMLMTKENINKSTVGFEKENKKKED